MSRTVPIAWDHFNVLVIKATHFLVMVSAVQVGSIIMILSQLRKLCSIINHNVY